MDKCKLLLRGIFLLSFTVVTGLITAISQPIHDISQKELLSVYQPKEMNNVAVYNLSLRQALDIIQDDYHVIFVCENGLLDGKIVKYKKALSRNVLRAAEQVISGHDLLINRLDSHSFLIYKKIGNSQKEVSALQQRSITGKVTDATTGEPLPGVNIIVPRTTIGTATDSKGNYSLSIPETVDSLTFSYIGYITQTVAINDRTTIDVQLRSTTLQSSQLVVVGYGTQRKQDLTGSISSVSGSDLNIPTTSVDNALQGQIAGVQVVPNSGAPGSQATIYVRGVGTLNDASPLYVVDGLITNDISYLSPDNIESIDVLKDASAEAIYGSRGANGVIMITTKHGALNQPTQYNLNVYYGWQTVAHKIPLTNAEQYANLVNELNANIGLPKQFDNPASFGVGTNWQNLVYKIAPIQNYDMSVNGGTHNMTYSITGNYINQKGIVPKSGYERVSLRINNTYQFSSNVELGHNLIFIHSYNNQTPNVIGDTYRAVPTSKPYDSNGDFADITALAPVGNPLATINYTNNRYYSNEFNGNLYVNLSFLKNFQFRSSFGIDLVNDNNTNFFPRYFVSTIQQNTISSVNVESSNNHNWLWENTLTYNESFGQHQVKVLAGITAQGAKYENLTGARNNIVGTEPALWYLSAGDAQTATNDNTANDWTMLSYLARVNYSYRDTYLLTATIRADGSSRFGKNNRYGYFPSVGVGWRISNEPFLAYSNLISNLKVRASWGKTGNDKISNYPGIPTVSGNLNATLGNPPTVQYGATVINLANPDVKWEETEQTDIGIDVGFLRNRLRATIDYYFKKTNGILVQVPIPTYIGVNTFPYVNAATVVNYGFEFDVKWSDVVGEFNYSIGVIASTVHNTVRSLGQGNTAIFGGGVGTSGLLASRTIPGGPIGAFYGYKVLGVFQTSQEVANSPTLEGYTEQPGDLKYADTNDDKVITTADRTYLGSPIPSFTYGINLGAAYKGFDLSANFDGQTGNKIYNAKMMARFGTPNFEKIYLQSWNGEGTSNTVPRVTNSGVNYQVSSFFLVDGSFLRLRNVQLGYTLPDRYIKTLSIRKLRIYVSGTNLFTDTKYTGYTPQFAGGTVIDNNIDRGIYPVARTISLGINLNF